MTDGRPWVPVPRPGARMAPSSRRTTWRARPACDPARGRLAVDAAIATNAVLGVVTPRLRPRRRRVLADLGRGGRSPAGAQRLGPGAGRHYAAALRASRPRDDPAARPWSITVPGAVRSWGDAHARFGRLARRISGPGHRAGRRRLPGLGRLRRGRGADRAADRVDDRERRRRSCASTGPRPALAARRARPQPALAATLEAIGHRRVRGVRRGDWGRAGRAAWTPPAARSRPTTSATTPRPGPTRSRSTIAASGSRPIRPTAPGSSRSRSSPSSRSSSRRPRPAFGPDGVTDAGLDPPRDRGGEAGHGRSRRASDRPRQSATSRSRACSIRPMRPSWPRGSTRAAPPARPVPRTRRVAARSISRSSTATATRSASSSRSTGVRVGRPRPGHRYALPEPGRLLQPRPGAPECPRAGQAHAPHVAPRDAVP